MLEVPNSALGNKKMGLWARTLDGTSGKWVQADRGARPNQTPFLAGEQNAAYLAAEPADDARFVPVFAHALEHTGGYTPAEATRVAGTLLPDVLHYDPTRPASFPNNGRALTDDVVDFFLPLLTNGKVTEDNVGPHKDLLAAIPLRGPAAQGPGYGTGCRLSVGYFPSGSSVTFTPEHVHLLLREPQLGTSPLKPKPGLSGHL